MKAYTPTTAGAMTGSSIAGGMAGGTPIASAQIKPLPIGAAAVKAPHVNIRGENAPVNHFQTPAALPHMIHPSNGVGMPEGGK